MSGGSWDYFTLKCKEVAVRLDMEKSPLRRALGAHMHLIAAAMHDIEWADSGDIDNDRERGTIKAALSGEAITKKLTDDARDVIAELKSIIDND